MKKTNNITKIIIIIVLFVIAILLAIFITKSDKQSFIINGKLIINEIMSNNTYTIPSDDNKYYDYIEIYNGYDYDINLSGYYLSDNNNYYKWKFPDITIKSNEYLLIYASGLNKCENNICHTNFKLNATGETLVLTNSKKEIITKVTYQETVPNTAYGYDGKKYVYYYNGTPGNKNDSEYSDNPIVKQQSNQQIRINEYVNNNQGITYDEYKEKSNWVELYNYGNKDIDLSNYNLIYNTQKYIFNSTILKKGEYLVIYLDGKNKIDKNIHANIKLLNETGTILLETNTGEIIDSINTEKLPANISQGYHDDKFVYYDEITIGNANSKNYYNNLKDIQKQEKELIINEIFATNNSIEIKNISQTVINLKNYKLSNKDGEIIKLPDTELQPQKYYVTRNLNISSKSEIISLYKDTKIIDTFKSGKMLNNNSYGLNKNGEIVLFVNNTIGKDNGNNTTNGYLNKVMFSIQGGYVEKNTKVELSSLEDATIYYTLDGSFPTKTSKKYQSPITINNTTIIKAIAIKENYLNSEIESRTYLIGRKHDIPVVSISSDYDELFGFDGLISNFQSTNLKKISLEYYETDGSFGTNFVGEAKLSGNFGGSRDKAQRGMSIYLRDKYGKDTIEYPFFDNNTFAYSSILLRNGGEDYLNIHIFDAALQYALKGQMDLDIQDYKPVVVYINGKYYGIYNLRDKLNSDYVSNKYDISKNKMDVIRYSTATKGTTDKFNQLVNYINNHDCRDKNVYEYLKTQIDMQELCNYWIVQSYYGNSDLGNVKYYKTQNGKWRFMLFDIDWSLYNTNKSFTYPVLPGEIPAVTYIYSTIEIPRRLYQNSEFRDLYLRTLSKHLQTTFKPKRMNEIIDTLSKEIEKELPYHMERWQGTNSSLGGNMNTWKYNLGRLKEKLSSRYNYVTSNLKNNFGLSNEEYKKYFGDLK